MTTYKYQSSLQKLPIPPLDETCASYLDVLKPLQTEREHLITKEAVRRFLEDGSGKYLDEQLRKYAETRNSYIEQFWYDSYLNYDSPVVLNLNPFFLLEDDPFTNDSVGVSAQVKRAVSLTISSLKFVRSLRNETLSVDMLKNGQPLCMFQYSKLFGASRIPTESGCIMQTDQNANHIVVMSKSQFYWFDVLDSNNDLILSEAELTTNFNSIIKDSLSTPTNEIARSSYGVLTTENRRIWAKIRSSNSIQRNSVNSDILSIIDSSLFVVCLDDVKLDDLSDLAKNMLCGLSVLENGVQVGTCTNRWYDKLQIIITENAKVGINFEHTGVDGHTVLRFVSDIYTDSILSFAKSINANTPSLWDDTSKSDSAGSNEGDTLVKTPRKLEWDLTPDLSLALRFGETRLSDLINQNEFKQLEFKGYGSTSIKKMKYSPDAFVQLAFQATYYALYGKVECTYEPAMTKQFFHGRTEAIRTVSQESNLFVRKFFDPSISGAEKLSYLSKACTSHGKQTKKASMGHGVDRHLFALFSIWKRYVDTGEEIDEETVVVAPDQKEVLSENEPRTHRLSSATLYENEDNKSDSHNSSDHTIGNDIPNSKATLKNIPEIFADNGWDKLNETIISTSNCGNPSLRLFGFGPVSANGFGLAYIIKDDSISISASSKHRQTERFLVTLNSYFNQIMSMYKEVYESPERPEVDSNSLRKPLPRTNTSSLLGGYGYFDMGDDEIKSRGPTPEPSFLNRQNSGFSVREIGKKLRLSEY